jgi:hypothetical protein
MKKKLNSFLKKDFLLKLKRLNDETLLKEKKTENPNQREKLQFFL